tara:strand:- start:5659 stop:5880 length:222 start_codon:yes stop_codon:yes gene_type:complete
MITREDLLGQKEKLLRDRQTVETRLQSVKEEYDNLVSTLTALEGAMQTVDYFLNKNENSSTDSQQVEDSDGKD